MEMTASPSGSRIPLRRVVGLTWPMILSNIATPLLGLVDTAILGNLGDPAYLAAIALGTVVFNFIFWGLGFLRMGTTGMTAQSIGAGDDSELRATLGRGLLMALVIGVLLVLLQWPIAWLAFALLGGSEDVESLAKSYFYIRLCGAPAALSFLVLMGWFIGLQKTRTALLLQVLLNSTNIVLDLVFVLGFGWGIKGVAAGTLIANVLGAGVGIWLAVRYLRKRTGAGGLLRERARLFAREKLAHTFRVNRDILIRTIMLVFGLTWFTNQGALMGDVTLAANTVLMQFFSFAAFFLDGIAFTAETLVGEAVGKGSRGYLSQAVRKTTVSAIVVSGALTILYAAGGSFAVQFLTDIEEVRAVANEHLLWAIVIPVVGLWCWQLDGIFIGATYTTAMRDAAIYSLVVFLVAWYFLIGPYENHGLWASLMIYLLARAVCLGAFYPRLVRKVV